MSYYKKNAHILCLSSQAKLPELSILKSNAANVYTPKVKHLLFLYINWIPLVTNLKMKMYISLNPKIAKADNNGKYNRLLN